METTNLKLYAANGTDIPLLGSVEIPIIIEGYDTTVMVVVSEVLDELMQGVDWLTKEGCVWDFKKAVLNIGAWQVPVRHCPACSKVPLIIVASDQRLPAWSFKDVPVKVVWNDLSDRTPDWVPEPNQVRRCVVTARSLINGTATERYMRIFSCDDYAHRLRAG
jgi:hypothetical protein